MNNASKIIHLPWAHGRNILGEGIGVAVVDTGIGAHPDFIDEDSRVVAFKDFINRRVGSYDDNGHGTHVAGIIGGNGRASRGLYTGLAPKCNLISVKVLNYKGNGNIADVLAGLEWIIKNRKEYNIRIVNISVGTTVNKNYEENSLLVQGVNEIWNSGIIVLAAAGNNGPLPQTIGAPGNSRRIITVGASDDYVSVDIYGNRIKDYSGRGPTSACIKKPDIVAPGSNIVSCNARSTQQMGTELLAGFKKNKFDNMYTVKSGTSMSTPMVSGAIALLLGEYPEMNNREVKIRLKNSAVDLGFPHEKQGWGMLNIENLLSL